MKKLLVLILSLLMLTAFFSSCTSNETDFAYIKKNKKLKVGITYFAPMNYLENGELTGFETEFTKAVCEELGVEAEFKEINWKTKEVELNAKNIDTIWNGMTINDERKETMSISKPYMKNKQVLIVKKENLEALSASVDGKKVVAEAGSAGETVANGNKDENIAADEFFKNATYTAVDAQTKALLEVKAGTADACVVDYVLSIGLIGEGTDYDDLVVVESREFAPEEYGIAFRKADTELTKKVNEAIDKLISSGKLEEIAKKYKLEDQVILN